MEIDRDSIHGQIGQRIAGRLHACLVSSAVAKLTVKEKEKDNTDSLML
jgi:hypothetical protein